MRPLIDLEQIRGVFALPPTPSTPNASDPEADFAVDLDEAERVTRALVRSGVGAIMTNGSLGEMATLSHDEWLEFNKVVVETARLLDADLPVFVGVTSLSTRATISSAREVAGFGGRGIFVGRPFWCPLDPPSMLDFYRALAEAVPQLGICIYDNPDAFKGPIPTAVYEEISRLPQLLAAKYFSLTPKFNRDMSAVDGRMRLLPIEMEWFAAWTQWPEHITGCWSSSAACGPSPVLRLAQALQAGETETARELTRRIQHAADPFLATRNWPEFTKYNIPLEKVRFDESGFVRAGPARHPYHYAPQEYIDGSIESAKRWKSLCDETL